MKLLAVICILVSAVNSLPNEDTSLYDYYDFADLQRIVPLESFRAPRARSFDTVVSASERSDNFATFLSPQSANRRNDSPGRRPSNGRLSAPIQPLRSLARPINQRRFTQNVNANYDSGSPSFNQPRFRTQQRLRPSQQYFPDQQYRPENSRPQPQFRQQPQYVAEPQYRPNTQYRPKPQFKPDTQFAPNYVEQIEEPTYQDSVDYQDLPITYEETPIIKTKQYVFDDLPQYQDEFPHENQNEQPQYQDEYPRPHRNEQPQYQDEHSQAYQNQQPQYQDEHLQRHQNQQPQYHDEQPQAYQKEQPQYQDEYPQYDELPVYQDYEQEKPKQQEKSRTVVESNRDQSQATVNALPVQDKEAQESTVIEKRQVGAHGDLDAAGQAFAANAAAVENAKDAGRLSFQIHGQQGPHSYRFGYDTGKGYNRQFRYEERDGDGHVHGRYGFYDEHGKLKVTNYSAHPKHGYSADVPKDR